MTTTTQKCLFAAALVLVGLVIIAGILFWKPGVQNYPGVLVETDSAYTQGYFERGDSLLACYQSQKQEESMPVRCYRQFLELTQKYLHIQLDENHFSEADSLERYYKGTGEGSKHARTLLFLGNLYAENGNNPTALDYFLRAIQEAKQTKDTHLECLINYELADLYFKQLMYDDCVPYYQNYYRLAVACHDTLRMANGSYCMGLVWTIKNDVDSAIFYHHQAIRLEQEACRKLGVIRIAEYRLCDLYIQIEEYDSAKAIMPRDLLNYENWAYWHYGQDNQDSAAYYFQAMLDYDGWKEKTEHLKVLIQIMESQNRQQEAMDYYRQLVASEDSLKNSLQVEKIQKANAQYNYATIKEERDEMESYGQRVTMILIFTFVGVLLLAVISFFGWKAYQQKKNAEVEREKRLKKEEMDRRRQSLQQLEENKQRIESLAQQLAEAKKAGDTDKALQLELDTRVLDTENQNIEARQQRTRQLRERLTKHPIYLKIKKNAGNTQFCLKDEEWEQLASAIDETYTHFTARLLDIANLKTIEQQVCLLLKIEVQPVDIAILVFRSRSAISMMCQRLCKKLMHREGKAQDLYDFIRDF